MPPPPGADRVKLFFCGGELLYESLSWKKHIEYNENKIAKNLGLLYKAKRYLEKRSLLVLYYSFLHTYINYGNIAWASTNKTIQQSTKYAIRIIHCKDRELFRKSKYLNVFQINILNNLLFMHQTKSQTAPKIFQDNFRKPTHKYLMRHPIFKANCSRT